MLIINLAGLRLKTLNLGNQCCEGEPETIRLADSFYVSRHDLAGLTRLQMAGLEVVLQAVPAGKAVKWRPAKK
ncbi:PTS sugar transporter subunit IIB [Deltaproteobacteria bacterium OttesenSCG-928-M10]|nr:PTS sugar transporter subunit IIB [Deltaproteobacteria bacterium OttesenSCG-928-M10]